MQCFGFWFVLVVGFWCGYVCLFGFFYLLFGELLFSETGLILACTYTILFIGPGIITASENKIESYLVAPKYQFMCPGP